ncbi:MAG: 2OG-Fe(II) oxygenase [Deltaproteobacteria bacterium]|nr:2OG-Fe(II) oxygenase [Deltaproteobacteria bacterium]
MDILIPGIGRPYVDGDSLDLTAPVAFTIPGVMTAAECAAMVARIDALVPTEAPISTPGGPVMRPDVRNNQRAMFDDVPFAAALFDRIASKLPTLCGTRPVGTNERFRAYRYEPGQRFAPHFDGCFRRNDSERSELTFMVYLNDGFSGGSTQFHDYEVDVRPQVGMALLFQHRVLHEGCVVNSGTKYVLRSDVMYRGGSK